MRPEVRNFMIGSVLAVGAFIFRDPIIAAAEDLAHEVKSWFGPMESKPRQSSRMEELDATMDIGVEQSGDE